MATITWTGGSDHKSWLTAGNWSSSTVPGTTDTAMVTLSGAGVVLTPTLAMGGATVGTVDFYGGPSLGTGVLDQTLTASVVALQGKIELRYSGVIDTGAAYVTNVNTIVGKLNDTGVLAVGGAASGTLLETGNFAARVDAGSLLIGGNTGVHGNVYDTGSNGVTITGAATIGQSGTGGLTFAAGGYGTIGGNVYAGVSKAGRGLVDINYGRLTVGGTLFAGISQGATASITLAGNADMTVGGDLVAGVATSAAASVYLNGSNLTVGGNLLAGVSQGAAASITLAGNAGMTVGDNAYVGQAGAATLSAGAGSYLVLDGATTAGILFVGSHGKVVEHGAYGVTANAVIVAAGAYLGLLSSTHGFYLQGASDTAVAAAPVELVADGFATLDGVNVAPGLKVSGGLIAVGDGAAGTLSVSDTASLKGVYTEVGVSAGDHGTLLVNTSANLSDTGKTVAGGLFVGVAGTGVATINLGEVSDALNSAIGVSTGGVGVVTVDGTNLATGAAGYWLTGTLDVGVAGSGTLVVGNATSLGGTVDVAAMVLGASSGGTGVVTVQHYGSIADANALVVGGAGSGSLEIDFGTVSVQGSLVAGDAAGSHGTINLTSASSVLSVAGPVELGNGGSGTLLVGAASSLALPNVVELGVLGTGAGVLSLSGTATQAGTLLAGVGGTGVVTIGSAGSLNDAGLVEVGAAGTGSGTISILGGTLSAATIALGAGGTILGQGDITFSFSSDNAGTIEASGGTLTVNGIIGGAGTLAVVPAAQLDVLSVSAPQIVQFEPGTGHEYLGLLAPGSMAGTIEGFNNTTTTIDLLGIKHTLTQAETYDNATHVLTVSDGSSVEATLTFDASNTFTTFKLKADSAGSGTDVVACYATGTRIATSRGEVEVEHLQPGDLLATMSGALRPVVWIGRRSYGARFVAENPHLHPVRVRRDALGEGMPRRDLLLSPLHAILVDGVLVPVGALINGFTIVRERVASEVTYLHIELASHDIILAEGLPSETFIDEGNRGMFQNAHDYVAPAGGPPAPVPCRPRSIFGPRLDRIRARLGCPLPTQAVGPLSGNLERADRFRVEGWCVDAGAAAVAVEIWADGTRLAAAQAASYRTDLDRAGLRDGACAFILDFDPPLPETTREIIVCRAGDRAPVPGSSWPAVRAA